jgi:hypothetical protein
MRSPASPQHQSRGPSPTHRRGCRRRCRQTPAACASRRHAGQRQMAHHQLAHRHERKAQGSFCCGPRARLAEHRRHDRWRAGPLRLSFSRSADAPARMRAASPAIWARVRACSEAPGDNARPIGSPTLRTSPKWTSVELPSCWSASDPCGDSRQRPGTPEGFCAAAIWNLAHEMMTWISTAGASFMRSIW